MVSSGPPTSTPSLSSKSSVPDRALEPDELQLVGLGGKLGPGLLVGHDPAGEALALLDDLAHPRLDGLQVIGGERLGHVEVVVEAVVDRRADAELGLREQLLHGLGHDVRGRVAQDVAAVVAGDVHRLHDVPVGQRPGQVAQLTVDLRGDEWPSGPQRRARRRARLDHMLASGEGDAKLRAGHGGLLRSGDGLVTRCYRCAGLGPGGARPRPGHRRSAPLGRYAGAGRVVP